jgi:hypothetical protein
MAINYGEPSNYQGIAQQGQNILLELAKMRQQNEAQRSAQIMNAINAASAQTNAGMTNFAHMKVAQQEGALNRENALAREQLQQEGADKRAQQAVQVREQLARDALFQKLGYVDQQDVSAADQFKGDLDLFKASNPNASVGDFVQQKMAQVQAIQKMNERTMKVANEMLPQAMQHASSLGLDLGTYLNIREDKDQYRGWGLAPERMAEAQRLERALAQMADDPEFQDFEGQQLRAELQQKINAAYSPGPYARQKEPEIADSFNPQALPPGMEFVPTGKNAGVMKFPNGEYSAIYMSPNRTTGQMEFHQVASSAAPKEPGGDGDSKRKAKEQEDFFRFTTEPQYSEDGKTPLTFDQKVQLWNRSHNEFAKNEAVRQMYEQSLRAKPPSPSRDPRLPPSAAPSPPQPSQADVSAQVEAARAEAQELYRQAQSGTPLTEAQRVRMSQLLEVIRGG